MNTTFPSEDMAHNAARVWRLAKSIRVAMISPRDALMAKLEKDGDEPANTVAGAAADTLGTFPVRARFQDDSNVIWFILPRRSPLAGLARDKAESALLVTFSNGSDGDHIVFDGTATLSEDRGMLEKLWDSHADIHFPQGPEDRDAVLMRFAPRTAQFWTGGQDMVSFAVHYVTAKLTGEAQKVGRQGTVMPI